MPTWAIVLIVVFVLGLLFYTRKHIAATVKKAAPGLPLRNAVESIPVYGTIIKGGRTVLTPVHKFNNKVNTTITAGLQHIPVVGTYLAIPNQLAGKAVYKVTDYFGLN